jgi:hypothetical protein
MQLENQQIKRERKRIKINILLFIIIIIKIYLLAFGVILHSNKLQIHFYLNLNEK